MQVTVATRLAVRVWHLVDATIRSGDVKVRIPEETTSHNAVARAFIEFDPQTADECWTAYSAKRNWLLAHQSQVETVVSEWDDFSRSLRLASPEQFDEISHASGLPTHAEDLGVGYDDDLLFWALRNSHLLRERISIVDLADLLGVWSDDTARSIVADAAKAME
jgi:glycerol-1-phosphate dehydrogenase [NAD(P)+]